VDVGGQEQRDEQPVAARRDDAQQAAPRPKTLFTNVHVFDGVNEKRIINASVLVEGNLIREVSTARIDAPGATSADLASLGHTICARPMYPMEPDTTFEPKAVMYGR